MAKNVYDATLLACVDHANDKPRVMRDFMLHFLQVTY